MAYRSHLRLEGSGGALLCRVDLRIGESESYGFAHAFAGGWILLSEMDGDLLKCHSFTPSDERELILEAFREDAQALADEAKLVMAFGSQEGTGQEAEEENVEK